MPELTDIALDQIEAYENRALFRLHLFLTGKTHALFGAFGEEARSLILRSAGSDGKIEPVRTQQIARSLADLWATTWGDWTRLFEEARYQAGAIPYGALALRHYHFMRQVEPLSAIPFLLPPEPVNITIRLPESYQPYFEAGEFGPPQEGQVKAALDWAASQAYADRLVLSQRLWKLNDDSLKGIIRVVSGRIALGESAWDTAKALETYLGYGAECPRWTRDRLYGLTKREIEQGDLTGLIGGHECGSRGVSYNALRLARTEIQVVHNKAAHEIMLASPWVEGINVVINPQHPKPDICDEHAGKSPYKKNEVPLPPFHAGCLCFLESVLMKTDDFTARMTGWQGNPGTWPEMNAYQAFAGATVAGLITPLLLLGAGLVMSRWLWGEEPELEAPFEAATAAMGAVQF